MRDFESRIIENKKISDEFYALKFSAGWKNYDPGQFVMISIPGDEVFFRRPFGILDTKKGVAEVCYKVVGRGTGALSKAKAGAKINVLGPCGRGFSVPKGKAVCVLVAGGYGIAPLIGLAEKIAKAKREVILFYGAKTASRLLYMKRLRKMGVKLELATEDGKKGAKGFVTDLLEKKLGGFDSPHLFACGPDGLLKKVAAIGRSKKIPAQISIESHMACGIGVCLGCVCKDAKGDYVRVCREGPVFNVKEINL